MSGTNLQVGAYGWLHQSWQGSFYPDDLPQEWYLDFYSNEFNTVMIPADYWQAGTGYDCTAWLQGIHDDFRFYVEFPAALSGNKRELALFEQQLRCLQGVLSGVVVTQQLPGSEVVIQALQAAVEQTVLFSNTSLKGLDCQPLWQPSAAPKGIAQLAIFEDDLRNLRATRQQIDAFIAAGSNHQALDTAIVVRHEALNAESLRKLRSVIEIMGL